MGYDLSFLGCTLELIADADQITLIDNQSITLLDPLINDEQGKLVAIKVLDLIVKNVDEIKITQEKTVLKVAQVAETLQHVRAAAWAVSVWINHGWSVNDTLMQMLNAFAVTRTSSALRFFQYVVESIPEESVFSVNEFNTMLVLIDNLQRHGSEWTLPLAKRSAVAADILLTKDRTSIQQSALQIIFRSFVENGAELSEEMQHIWLETYISRASDPKEKQSNVEKIAKWLDSLKDSKSKTVIEVLNRIEPRYRYELFKSINNEYNDRKNSKILDSYIDGCVLDVIILQVENTSKSYEQKHEKLLYSAYDFSKFHTFIDQSPNLVDDLQISIGNAQLSYLHRLGGPTLNPSIRNRRWSTKIAQGRFYPIFLVHWIISWLENQYLPTKRSNNEYEEVLSSWIKVLPETRLARLFTAGLWEKWHHDGYWKPLLRTVLEAYAENVGTSNRRGVASNNKRISAGKSFVLLLVEDLEDVEPEYLGTITKTNDAVPQSTRKIIEFLSDADQAEPPNATDFKTCIEIDMSRQINGRIIPDEPFFYGIINLTNSHGSECINAEMLSWLAGKYSFLRSEVDPSRLVLWHNLLNQLFRQWIAKQSLTESVNKKWVPSILSLAEMLFESSSQEENGDTTYLKIILFYMTVKGVDSPSVEFLKKIEKASTLEPGESVSRLLNEHRFKHLDKKDQFDISSGIADLLEYNAMARLATDYAVSLLAELKEQPLEYSCRIDILSNLIDAYHGSSADIDIIYRNSYIIGERYARKEHIIYNSNRTRKDLVDEYRKAYIIWIIPRLNLQALNGLIEDTRGYNDKHTVMADVWVKFINFFSSNNSQMSKFTTFGKNLGKKAFDKIRGTEEESPKYNQATISEFKEGIITLWKEIIPNIQVEDENSYRANIWILKDILYKHEILSDLTSEVIKYLIIYAINKEYSSHLLDIKNIFLSQPHQAEGSDPKLEDTYYKLFENAVRSGLVSGSLQYPGVASFIGANSNLSQENRIIKGMPEAKLEEYLSIILENFRLYLQFSQMTFVEELKKEDSQFRLILTNRLSESGYSSHVSDAKELCEYYFRFWENLEKAINSNNK